METDSIDALGVSQQAELDGHPNDAVLIADFQAMIAQCPAGMALFVGENVQIQAVNEGIAAMWDRPVCEVIGLPLLEAVPEIAGQGFDDLVLEVLHTGVPYEGKEDLAIIRRNGIPTPGYYNFVFKRYHAPDGHLVGVICVGLEVTSLVQARRAVEAREVDLRQLTAELEVLVDHRTRELVESRQLAERRREHLDTIVDQTFTAICVLDAPDLRVSVMNPRWAEIVNLTGRKVLGEPVFELIPELIDQGFQELLQGVLDTGQPVEFREMPAEFTRNGVKAVRYFDANYQAHRDAAGAIVGVIVTAQEVTDQREAREQLAAGAQRFSNLNDDLNLRNSEFADNNALLKTINSDLDTFIYTASHDLKAPITNIQGLQHLLRAEWQAALEQTGGTPLAPDSDVVHILDMMDRSIERFMHTISDLADVVRVQRSQDEVRELIEIPAVFDDVLLDMQAQILAADATIELSLDSCRPLRYSAKNLRSVLYNLLSNALKYRDPQRPLHVRIGCAHEADYQVISVRDTGLGMDLSGEHKLFTMFGRLHDHVEGSGVGLHMIKRIIENNGGKLEVESEVGTGSTFQVYFNAEP